MTEIFTPYSERNSTSVLSSRNKLSQEDEYFFSSLRMRLNNRLLHPSTTCVQNILIFAKGLK